MPAGVLYFIELPVFISKWGDEQSAQGLAPAGSRWPHSKLFPSWPAEPAAPTTGCTVASIILACYHHHPRALHTPSATLCYQALRGGPPHMGRVSGHQHLTTLTICTKPLFALYFVRPCQYIVLSPVLLMADQMSLLIQPAS